MEVLERTGYAERSIAADAAGGDTQLQDILTNPDQHLGPFPCRQPQARVWPRWSLSIER